MWTSTDRREGVFHIMLRYLEDDALRRRVHAQLNKGEKLHDLRKFLFFAREGVVRQKYEEGQANQAGCLNLLTNAVIVWNTVYIPTVCLSVTSAVAYTYGHS